MKHKRTKATDISQAVRLRVYERDGGLCIFCGRPGLPNMHYIGRAQGGLGVEENIITGCIECHNAMDNGKDTRRSREMREYAERYLRSKYEEWSREKVVYNKWR